MQRYFCEALHILTANFPKASERLVMRARDIAARLAYLIRLRHVELELLIVLLAQPFNHVHRSRS
jgi:hypothetical protein